MIAFERYGIRSDGNTVVETTIYQEVSEDHPAAEQLEGHPGFWVRTSVGNSLRAVNAEPITKQRFDDANEEMRLRVEALREEAELRREMRRRELEGKKEAAAEELRKLGLSRSTIDAILEQVRS